MPPDSPAGPNDVPEGSPDAPRPQRRLQWQLWHLFAAMFIAASVFWVLREKFGQEILMGIAFAAGLLGPIIAVLCLGDYVDRMRHQERPFTRTLFTLGLGCAMLVVLPIVFLLFLVAGAGMSLLFSR